jgi:hypothetical protein
MTNVTISVHIVKISYSKRGFYDFIIKLIPGEILIRSSPRAGSNKKKKVHKKKKGKEDSKRRRKR